MKKIRGLDYQRGITCKVALPANRVKQLVPDRGQMKHALPFTSNFNLIDTN